MTHVRFMVLCPGGLPRAARPAAENQPCSMGSAKPLLVGSPTRGHRTKKAVLTFPTVPGRITTGNFFALTRANHRVKHAADNAWPKVLAASIGLKEHIGTRLVSFQSICQNRVDCLCLKRHQARASSASLKHARILGPGFLHLGSVPLLQFLG